MSEEPRVFASAPGRMPRGRAGLYALFLLVIPTVLWMLAVVVPFLPLEVEAKIWLVSSFAVAAEVVFWGAALVLGREVAVRYRRYFDPRKWFRKDGTGR